MDVKLIETVAKRRWGLGLESRARCAGFSVTEIGNRKKRLRFYASFPGRKPDVPHTRKKAAGRPTVLMPFCYSLSGCASTTASMISLRSSVEIPASTSLIFSFSSLPCFTPTAICASSGETVKP